MVGDHGKDTGDRLGGLRLEQARRILVLVETSKRAKVIILVVRRKSRKLAECTTGQFRSSPKLWKNRIIH